MIRKIVSIDKEKCNGCGLCVIGCHENAIKIIDGKAELVKDDYCDGLGDCLPHCPKDAISIIEREARAYDIDAVINENNVTFHHQESSLKQWPCQIKLVSSNAQFLANCHLLIVADCVAYSYANFHKDFMNKRVTLIGCPKLDNTDYSERFTSILKYNNIKSVTLVKMGVPCCSGLEKMLQKALASCGKNIPYSVRVISVKGEVLTCY